MKRWCVVTIISTTLSTAAHAGPSIRGSLAWYTVPAAADIITTEIALGRPSTEEGNPALRGHVAKRATLLTASAVGLAAADAKLQQTGHRGWAWALRVVAIVAYGQASVRNARR